MLFALLVAVVHVTVCVCVSLCCTHLSGGFYRGHGGPWPIPPHSAGQQVNTHISVSTQEFIKFHVPSMTPAFKVAKIFLENLCMGRCWDGKIKSSVICKESHFGFDIHREIIYVDRKRRGPSTDPWGTQDETARYRFGWGSIYNDRLVAVIKKPVDPFKSRTSYTIVM